MNLAQHPLIKDITAYFPLHEEEQNQILNIFKPQIYPRHAPIFQSNAKLDQLYYISEGLAKLVFTDHHGKEYILGFAMENWWETDLGAFFYQQLTSVSLIAMEKTTALSISKHDYDQIQDQIPNLKSYFLHKSIAGAYASQQRILSLISLSASERYQQLLQHYPQWLQRIPKQYIATYLGVSRETLSRMIK